ncbi:hypothetical protein X275_03895 [Marinitoga sp. 1197]|uniref:hypothetical protein n=1 Tax=Marinitoga sp. 1197 TaxID=1428449 RepID=UPI0006414837|nr:hypothetical protein [Marinitoga sp. 1197]KLO23092.1 hypothetical protein X275_03895 [Marinitoga sp. 1197]
MYAGVWVDKVTEDLMTNKKTIMIFSKAVATDYDRESKLVLRLNEGDNSFDIFVSWGKYLGNDYFDPVEIKFDDETIDFVIFGTSVDKTASFFPNWNDMSSLSKETTYDI